jgi:transcriptional antiterminator RfaH
MPILPVEPDFYPPELWNQAAPMARASGDRLWRCLHSKPRQEKAVARELRRLGLTYYLPQVLKEDRTPQGRKIRSVIPLFPGYLFLMGDPEARLSALRGNRLVSILEVSDQSSLERDLRQIHAMLASGLPVGPEPAIPVGTRVRICSGPLSGVEGTVIRRGKRDQFVAVVRFLGRGAVMDLEDWQVERIAEG